MMIKVLAHKTINLLHRTAHWEMMRETCMTFNAELLDVSTNDIPAGTLISLRHDVGIPVSDFVWPDDPVILVGCDDSARPDDWLGFGQAVRIPTPTDYFLWSPVALGIAFYMMTSKGKIQ